MAIVQLVFNWKKMENFIALVPRYVYLPFLKNNLKPKMIH